MFGNMAHKTIEGKLLGVGHLGDFTEQPRKKPAISTSTVTFRLVKMQHVNTKKRATRLPSTPYRQRAAARLDKTTHPNYH